MCGICGIWYFAQNQQVDQNVLQSMTSSLAHRGPGDAGFYRDDSIGIGVRRLSILDKPGSYQPILNENEQICLVCNGEIYNFRSLREKLAERHHFRSDGDVETILHLYEDHQLQCIDHLRGMFAFALWDRSAQQLTFAVDRFGKKPLYYAHDTDKVIFASELKALLRYPGIQRELDYQVLDEYLTYGFVSAPRSIFKSIRRLTPAQIVTVSSNSSLHIETYWHPTFAEPDQWDRRSINDLAAELRHLLTEAVRLRMISDVPVGAFLSGGVDSTAVVALMTQISRAPVKTFSIGFDDPRYDERGFGKAAAAYLGSDHISEGVDVDKLDLLPNLVHHFDEPFADSSMIPTFLLSQLAHQKVTVALSGDGGDEVFAGYHQHLYGYRQFFLQTIIPVPFHSLASRLTAVMPSALKLKPYLAALNRPVENWITSGFFSAQQRSSLYTVEAQAVLGGYEGEQIKKDVFKRVTRLDELSQLQYHDLTRYLPNDILVKVDRASMFASLEVRSPLLDQEVFAFMARVPPRFRTGLTSGKMLLKKALAPLLPPFIHQRKKQGFSIPQAEWLRGELNPLLRDTLTNPCLPGLFNQTYVQQLIQEHSANQIDHKDRLWALLCFELWASKAI